MQGPQTQFVSNRMTNQINVKYENSRNSHYNTDRSGKSPEPSAKAPEPKYLITTRKPNRHRPNGKIEVFVQLLGKQFPPRPHTTHRQEMVTCAAQHYLNTPDSPEIGITSRN